MLWTRFSLRLSINVIVLSIPSTLTSTHSIRLQAPRFTVGDGIVEVMIIACFPLYIVTKDHKTRKSCFSQSESPLGVFCQFQVGFHVSSLRRGLNLESGQARSVECCCDVCHSVHFSHLHI